MNRMNLVMILLKRASVLAVALCVAVMFSCDDKKDDPEPEPVVGDLTYVSTTVKNRAETNEAGKAIFSDAVEVAGKLKVTTGDKVEDKDVKKETTLKSEAAWSATPITVSALTGEIAKRAAITSTTTGLTFDFGAFKLADAVKFTNPTYKLTENGKSVDIPFYGFNGGEPTADAIVEQSTVTEGGKNYAVTTVTQAFKIKHSDGSFTKECSIKASYRVEAVKRGALVKAEEISWNATYKTDENIGIDYYEFSYNIKLHFEGMSKDTTFSYIEIPSIDHQKTFRIFSDKPTITTPVVINTGAFVLGTPIWKVVHSKYLLERFDNASLSAPGVFGDNREIASIGRAMKVFKGTSGDLVLSVLPMTASYKSVSYETAFEETISGKVYTITPAKIYMTSKLGDQATEEGWVTVELCVEKK